MKMQARQHPDPLVFQDVEQSIAEPAQGRASDRAVHGLIALRIVAQQVFDTPDFRDERSSEAHALRLDIRRGGADLGACGRRVANRVGHCPLAWEEVAANLVQGEGRLVRVPAMVLQPRPQLAQLLGSTLARRVLHR